MKILFVTLEQSGRQILKSILDEKFFNIHKNQIFTYGIGKNYKDFICKCGEKNCCGYIVREGSRWRIKKSKTYRSHK